MVFPTTVRESIPVSELVTVEMGIGPYGQEKNLYIISAGFPILEAFEELESLLSHAVSIFDLLTQTEFGSRPSNAAVWSALKMLNMAEQLTNSMHSGLRIAMTLNSEVRPS